MKTKDLSGFTTPSGRLRKKRKDPSKERRHNKKAQNESPG